jgi:hypothetical protein
VMEQETHITLESIWQPPGASSGQDYPTGQSRRGAYQRVRLRFRRHCSPTVSGQLPLHFPKTAPIRSSIRTDILRRPTLAPPRGLTWTTTDRLEAPMTLSASAFFPANTEWSYTHVIPSFMRGYATSSCFCGRTCRTPCCRNIRTA